MKVMLKTIRKGRIGNLSNQCHTDHGKILHLPAEQGYNAVFLVMQVSFGFELLAFKEPCPAA